MELGDAYPAVVTIVLIGVMLGVGLLVLGTFRDTIATEYTGTDNTWYPNASADENHSYLSDSALTNYKLEQVVSVINATAANDITISMYEIVGDNRINWTNADWGDGAGTEAVNISTIYTYDLADSAEEAITSIKTGTDDFADWMAIIIIVIAAGIVLGLILKSFGRESSI